MYLLHVVYSILGYLLFTIVTLLFIFIYSTGVTTWLRSLNYMPVSVTMMNIQAFTIATRSRHLLLWRTRALALAMKSLTSSTTGSGRVKATTTTGKHVIQTTTTLTPVNTTPE